MARWLLKTEPSEFSWYDLVRDGGTVWNGVSNAQALIHLRAMAVGDQVVIYHTGTVRAAVGLGQITKAAYPDPQQTSEKLVVVDVAPLRELKKPVSLAQIKNEPSLADWALVRHSRLSVMPCSDAQWAWLLAQSEA